MCSDAYSNVYRWCVKLNETRKNVSKTDIGNTVNILEIRKIRIHTYYVLLEINVFSIDKS